MEEYGGIQYWANQKLSQLMRLWYLSHRRPAKAQAILRIRAVSTEPPLFAHMKYGSRRRFRPKIRHLASLKNEFTEDKKCHNLMRGLSCLYGRHIGSAMRHTFQPVSRTLAGAPASSRVQKERARSRGKRSCCWTHLRCGNYATLPLLCDCKPHKIRNFKFSENMRPKSLLSTLTLSFFLIWTSSTY